MIGSCELLRPDGSTKAFDRKYDQQLGGRPGQLMKGLAAYRAAWGRPEGAWLPIRAMGILIDRRYLNELNIEFPRGEHEDLCFTPLLYYRSNGVLYDEHIVLAYRHRADSISNTPWSAARMRRFAGVWRQMRSNLIRFELDGQLGDTAVKFVESMVWKLQANGIDLASDEDILDVLEEILADSGNLSDQPLFFYAMDQIKRNCGFIFRNPAMYRRLTAAIPADVLLEYYRSRAGYAGVTLAPDSPGRTRARQPDEADGPRQGQQATADPRMLDTLLLCDRCLQRITDLATELAEALKSPPRGQDAEARISEANARADQANDRAGDADARYGAIIRSTSWRMTAPLRRLSILLGKVKVRAVRTPDTPAGSARLKTMFRSDKD